MTRVRALLVSFLGAAVLMAALSYDAVLWAQDFAAGFPGGGGRGIGLLNALYCQLASPCVLTGDNASGTGTLRIRPSDEDTQLVLCEASNNASPEVCSALQHYNAATTTAGAYLSANGYIDSAGTPQRYNTSFGVGQLNFSSSSVTANNYAVFNVYGTGGAVAGNAGLAVSGLATSTFITGTLGTVTNDFRGPILNGGSATCNGVFAGTVCYTDDVTIAGAGNSLINLQPGTTSTAAGVTFNVAGAAVGSSAYYGSTSSDADYADKLVYAGFSKLVSFIRADNVGDGTAAFEWRDNASATGVLLADIDGVGRIRPLLYGSQSNCSDGAGAAGCSAAPVGGVVIDAAATTVVVSTTAVTANSRIFLQEDTSLALTGSPTCNTDAGRTYRVTARTAGTSFTITSSAAPVTNPACLSYSILN